MSRHPALPEQLKGAAFSVRDGLAAGVGPGRLRGDDLARPFRGARVAESGPLSLIGLCQAYRARSPESHVFSHTTAAALWNAPLPAAIEGERMLHVATLGPGALPRAAGVIGHRVRTRAASVALRHGLPVIDPATTWLQLAGILRPDDLVAVGDHFVLDPAVPTRGERRPFVLLPDLIERTLGHRGPGAPVAREAVRRVRQGAESRPESVLRLAMIRSGLPEPELNPRLYDRAGRFLARADLVYRAQRVIVEYDGEQHRTDDRQYDRDLVRLDALRGAGWTIVQVRKPGLRRSGLPHTLARIRAALASTP